MRRWRSGTIGAGEDGNISWYILSWVPLALTSGDDSFSCMNLLWMALFGTIIFGEKIWLHGGIWVARSAGVGFMVIGILAILGLMEIPIGMYIGKDTGPLMDNSMDMTTTTTMDMSDNNNTIMKDNSNMSMNEIRNNGISNLSMSLIDSSVMSGLL